MKRVTVAISSFGERSMRLQPVLVFVSFISTKVCGAVIITGSTTSGAASALRHGAQVSSRDLESRISWILETVSFGPVFSKEKTGLFFDA